MTLFGASGPAWSSSSSHRSKSSWRAPCPSKSPAQYKSNATEATAAGTRSELKAARAAPRARSPWWERERGVVDQLRVGARAASAGSSGSAARAFSRCSRPAQEPPIQSRSPRRSSARRAGRRRWWRRPRSRSSARHHRRLPRRALASPSPRLVSSPAARESTACCRKELGRCLLCASSAAQRGGRLELCGDYLIPFCRAAPGGEPALRGPTPQARGSLCSCRRRSAEAEP